MTIFGVLGLFKWILSILCYVNVISFNGYFLLIQGHRWISHLHQFCVHMGPNAIQGFPVSGLLSCIHFNILAKNELFPTKYPRMIHCDICFHMWWVGASEYHFDEYKCIRMGLNSKNAFSGIFGFPLKNFVSPYLSSPTWQRGHSVLKIIV